MQLGDLLVAVEPEWHGQFQLLLDTGDASPEFMAYLAASKPAQRAYDAALGRMAAEIGDLQRAFWSDIDRVRVELTGTLDVAIAQSRRAAASR